MNSAHSANSSTTAKVAVPLDAPDRVFEAAKALMPYKFGSLWWGRDDLIHDKQPQFVERDDRIGHPLLSVKQGELKGRYDLIPMLVGTSGISLRTAIQRRCVQVSGIRSDEPRRVTFFGSIVDPGLYGFADLMDGIVHKPNSFQRPKKAGRDNAGVMPERTPWHVIRVMFPNQDKPFINPDEKRDLESYCEHYGLKEKSHA